MAQGRRYLFKIKLLDIQVKETEETDVLDMCLYQANNRVVKSSCKALELIGYLSEVVVLQPLLLRIKIKLLNGDFNKTD